MDELVQARPFGQLVYKHWQHQWCVFLGRQIALWVWSDTLQPEDGDVEGMKKAHLGVLTKTLSKHKIDVQIPEVDHLLKSKTYDGCEAILNTILKEHSATHCGFFLIGQIATMFGIAEIMNRRAYDKDLQARIKTNIDKLHQFCQSSLEYGLSYNALYFRLQATSDPHTTAMKDLLIDLQQPLTILLVLADPGGDGKFGILQQQTRLEQVLRERISQRRFKMALVHDTTMENFEFALAHSEPHVVHFCGNGSGMVFLDQSGKAEVADLEQVSQLLNAASKRGLLGIIFNACYTRENFQQRAANIVQPSLIIEGGLGNKSVMSFCQKFYHRLRQEKFTDAAELVYQEQTVDERDGVKKALFNKPLANSNETGQGTSSMLHSFSPKTYFI